MSVHLNHWKLDRRLGLGLMFLYAIFLLCSILFGQMWGLEGQRSILPRQHAEYLPFYHTSSFLKPKNGGKKNMTAFTCSLWEFLCACLTQYCTNNYTKTQWSLFISASSSPFGPLLCFQGSRSLSTKVSDSKNVMEVTSVELQDFKKTCRCCTLLIIVMYFNVVQTSPTLALCICFIQEK